MLSKIENFSEYLISDSSKVKTAISKLNDLNVKILFVVKDNILVGTITDGDIRRGLINNHSLDDGISSIMNKNPFYLTDLTTNKRIKEILVQNDLKILPKVNKYNHIEYLFTYYDPVLEKISNTMVIMAGGKGSRLLPLTKSIPKALVKVANHPMIEHIIRRGKKSGITNFIISINHLGDKIRNYLGTGSSLGVKISYIEEDSFLGTAGSLSLINKLEANFPILLTNCDVISDLNIKELINYHSQNLSSVTMVVKKHEIQNPFGIVKLNGDKIVGFEEKPIYRNFINTGIYILEKKIINLIKKNEMIDMPLLLERAISKGFEINAFNVHETWFDLGNYSDLENAHNYLVSNE